MSRARLVRWLGDRSDWLQEWFCNHGKHVLEPTEVTAFFRVEEAECVQCGAEFDYDAGDRPRGWP